MSPALAAELFHDWSGPLRRVLGRHRVAPSAVIDDIAQETFVRLLRYGDDELPENPLGFLVRVASNVASNWRELHCNQLEHAPEWLEDLLIEDEHEPEYFVAVESERRRIRVSIDALPYRQRCAVWMHINQDLSYRQIAERLGITHRQAMRDLVRAYAELRERLPDDEELDQ